MIITYMVVCGLAGTLLYGISIFFMLRINLSPALCCLKEIIYFSFSLSCMLLMMVVTEEPFGIILPRSPPPCLGVFQGILIVCCMSDILGGRAHWTPDMQDFKDCVTNSGLDELRSVENVLIGFWPMGCGSPPFQNLSQGFYLEVL